MLRGQPGIAVPHATFFKDRRRPLVLLMLAFALALASCSSSSSTPEGAPRIGQVSALGVPAWGTPAPMATARSRHTATLLPSGQVLVAGGEGDSGALASAEVFDPATGTWAAAAPLGTARSEHTATLLPSGQVLVVGGSANSNALNDAVLYDPATGTWAPTAPLSVARYAHTATLLSSGRVLVVGGTGENGSLASAELYDPATGTWAPTGSLTQAREGATVALLPSGRVLVAGGFVNSEPVGSAEVYDPATGTWSATGSLSQARYGHTMTLLPSGRVLVAGGVNPHVLVTSTEVYDPATGTWSATGSLFQARAYHTATLLPSGRVLVAGGDRPDGTFLVTSEVYDPATGTWGGNPVLHTGRALHTATLLPTGRVLVVGGSNSAGFLASVELCERHAATWNRAGSLFEGRYHHRSTLLLSGQVLVAGGCDASCSAVGVELFDPALGAWTPVGAMSRRRAHLTLTLLPSGRVLAVGGLGDLDSPGTAEVYDPDTRLWTLTAPLVEGRYGHTATLLFSGRVLVAGGEDRAGLRGSTEVYTPATGTWTATGSLASPRKLHTATLLPSGKVLVVGGQDASGALASAELYDPATDTWAATGSLTYERHSHTATLLPSGKVLVAGGQGHSLFIDSVELYDPATGTWAPTERLGAGRYGHTATLLPSGKVLVASGDTASSTPVNEVYDPATGTWTHTTPVSQTRYFHAATLLPSGRVLVTGGFFPEATAVSDVYDDTGANPAWRPVVDTVSPAGPLEAGSDFTLSGSRLRGISEASGGSSSSSPTNFPLLTMLSPEGDRWATLTPRSFSSTHVTASVPRLPPGPYLLFVTVNGLTSSTVLHIAGDLVPPDTRLTGAVPASLSRLDTARFTFTSDDASATFECSLDGAAFSPCTSPVTYGPLAEGPHGFRVRARDEAGNVDATPDFHDWRIDLMAPGTRIVSGPPALSPQPTATFTFESEAGVSYECGLNEPPSTPCGSPVTFSSLADGAYTFRVRARDAAGNVEEPPASYSWRVDLEAPETELLSTPDSVTRQRMATFTFAANEDGATFECSLDDSAFSACGSPVSHGPLDDGPHVFQVRALDAAGNVEATLASFEWRVDTRAPQPRFTTVPEDPSYEPTATFTFTADEQDVSFLCRLDNAGFAPCTSPMTVGPLAEGRYVFEVRARDAAGNMDPFFVPGHSWRVALSAPAVPVIITPAEGATVAPGKVVFSGTAQSGTTITLTLDGTVAGSVTTNARGNWVFTSTSELEVGTHTVTAQASDPRGSSGPGAPVRFIVGTTPEEEPSSGGCGCAANPGDASWMLAGLALLGGAVTRRRRPGA